MANNIIIGTFIDDEKRIEDLVKGKLNSLSEYWKIIIYLK